MNNNDILTINRKFYEFNAKSFSNTRQSPWPGWTHLLKYIEQLENPNVLDVGCGNGRFYKYLKQNLKKPFKYTGIDFSSALISEAKKQYGSDLFYESNILEPWPQYLNQFDFVGVFGVMHHIFEDRDKFIKQISTYLTIEGILAATFWLKAPKKDQSTNLDKTNDFLVNWNNENQNSRYIHVYTIEECIKIINNAGLEIVEQYQEDGHDRKSNLYIISKKV